MLKKLSIVLIVSIFTFSFNVHAEGTFKHIHQVLQTNCANSGCHNDNQTAPYLNFNLSLGEVYNQIVGAVPVNPHAASKEDQLIYPGIPQRSFLLRKINGGLGPAHLELDIEEGAMMPNPNSPLPDYEIETIRQWILQGAPETGTVVNKDLIHEYYTEGGLEISHVPNPPHPSEGFQLYFGPIFLEPNGEYEFLKKFSLGNEEKLEINRIDVFMNWESHHYIIYKFREGNGHDVDEGLRPISMGEIFGGGKDFVSAWQFTDDLRLPEGTAYFWEEDTRLDLNYHIRNYNNEKVLKAEVFMNVYIQEPGTAELEMHSQLRNYNYQNPSNPFFIMPGETKTFTEEVYSPNSNDTMYLWMLTSHTHQLGTDYKIWHRNPDGSKGKLLYDGHFNTAYEFDQGFYDYEHPAVRYFQPMYPIAMRDGIIHEATYHNHTNNMVTFGLTTTDEMMIFMSQYTFQRPSSDTVTTEVTEVSLPGKPMPFNILHNPVKENPAILINQQPESRLDIAIYNALGQIVWDGAYAIGEFSKNDVLHLPIQSYLNVPGTYYIRIRESGKFTTLPFVKL